MHVSRTCPPILIAATLLALAACRDVESRTQAQRDADIILEGMRHAYDPSRWPTAATPGDQPPPFDPAERALCGEKGVLQKCR